jgi:hypothetical protein
MPSLLALSLVRMTDASLRSAALLRCGIAGLAVERYRLANGRWPDALEQAVPKFLASVPLDPYDGKPLRFRRLEDGVVVYSVGPDGQDDGGKLNRKNPSAAFTDIGFRLWDVAHRRQPPKAPAPEGKRLPAAPP